MRVYLRRLESKYIGGAEIDRRDKLETITPNVGK